MAAVAHARGWPVARGGSQSIANALAAHFESLGGEIVTGTPEDLAALIKSDLLLYGKLVKDAKITAQ